MAGFDHPYLDLARMEMLRRVRIKPRGAVDGTFAGPHKSNYRGTALEFADYRNYVEGDDIRLVDWKVYARTDKHYVRLFEAERNLLSYLMVDTSGSMAFAGAEQLTYSKLEYACRLAAALAYLVVNEGDEIGLSLADEKVHTHLPTRSSWQHLGAVIDSLGKSEARNRTDLGGCMKEVYQRVSRRGVLIVLSDFLDTSAEMWKAFDLFRKSQFDIMFFQIVHPEEVELPDVPLARFVASEGDGASFDSEPDIVRSLYRQRFSNFVNEIKSGVKSRGGEWFMARTDNDPYMFLKNCFLTREVR